tara:strand:- start:67 stop:369 length:303 start_codon:yes stop_codon:yes gene_type:complete
MICILNKVKEQNLINANLLNNFYSNLPRILAFLLKIESALSFYPKDMLGAQPLILLRWKVITRSARFPTSIVPRSLSPKISAGRLEIKLQASDNLYYGAH